MVFGLDDLLERMLLSDCRDLIDTLVVNQREDSSTQTSSSRGESERSLSMIVNQTETLLSDRISYAYNMLLVYLTH